MIEASSTRRVGTDLLIDGGVIAAMKSGKYSLGME